MELPFAGLHQLCGPVLDGVASLPAPQRDALQQVFELRGGNPPERLVVGLAALGLLSAAAGQQPVVCVVDDVHWLDRASAQALAFVARRLMADPVAVVFAQRVSSAGTWPGSRNWSSAGWAIRMRVRYWRRCLASRSMSRFESASSASRTATRSPCSSGAERQRQRTSSARSRHPRCRLEAGSSGCSARVAELPTPTQRFLLVAAAEPVGDPVLVWRAARRVGLEEHDAPPAVESGLITLGTSVRFRHPLVRSAAYQSATSEDRRSADRALAEVTDPLVDPDRRAWHRARAALGPDEDVASSSNGARIGRRREGISRGGGVPRSFDRPDRRPRTSG